jgi:Flp pilus assembly protein TadG
MNEDHDLNSIGKKQEPFLRRAFRDESGQIITWASMAMMTALLCMAGLAIDVANAYAIRNQLQAAANAAALAGAMALPNTTATTQATTYSASTGNKNLYNGQANVKTTASLLCLTTLKNLGGGCNAPANANAVQVQQTAAVPTYFLKLFGLSALNVTAVGTAAAKGAVSTPHNVAIIVDTTLSMDSADTSCGGITQMACALQGVQKLLNGLAPCGPLGTSPCGTSTTGFDKVALFTFPNITVGTASIDYSCTTAIPASQGSGSSRTTYAYNSSFGYYSMQPQTVWGGVPTASGYTYPTVGATTYAPSGSTTPTYQVTPFLSDYQSSYAPPNSPLNTASIIVKAAGGLSGCGGMAPPNYDGNYGTYYAGVIYAAQAALTYQKSLNTSSQNVLILISDGDSTAPSPSQSPNSSYPAMPSPAGNGGTYPSYSKECGQAVTAAQYASAQGTIVYSVAYGSEATGCSSDSGTWTPCSTMAAIAQPTNNYFSDVAVGGSDPGCTSSWRAVSTLNQIFVEIASDLTTARLIPNSTT